MTLSHVTCRANCKYVVTCGKPPPNLLGAYSVAPHVTRLCQGGPLSAVRACARSNGTRCRSRDCLFITPSALPHLLPTNYRTLESPSPPVAKSKLDKNTPLPPVAEGASGKALCVDTDMDRIP